MAAKPQPSWKFLNPAADFVIGPEELVVLVDFCCELCVKQEETKERSPLLADYEFKVFF